MLFALIAEDGPDPEKRLDHRADHLAYMASLGDRIVFGGPFLNEDGAMVGSLLVIEADTREEAEALLARDPFMERGVFIKTSLRPFRLTLNNAAGR